MRTNWLQSGIVLALIILGSANLKLMGQSDLPLREIPEAPQEYTSEAVAARLIEGLGFRYYWATEGLRSEDLVYKPSGEARTCDETLDHIYGLAEIAYTSVFQKPSVRPLEISHLTFEEKRAATLKFLDDAAKRLRSGEVTLGDCPIVFERGESRSEFPFWNNINGPISDALWHCGQIVSFRRASGNPMPSGVSVFRGTVRDQ